MPIFLLQNGENSFDSDVIWNSIYEMLNSILRQLSYIIIGVIVFLLFLVAARIVGHARSLICHHQQSVIRLDHRPAVRHDKGLETICKEVK